MDVIPSDTAVILVDHGSRLAAANEMLEAVAAAYRSWSGVGVVEPAHMELAEPSLERAFARCVSAGARLVIVQPYFLAPGRHSMQDIPRLAAEAARPHAGVAWRVAEPLGLDDDMCRIIHRRVKEALGKEGR